jgi:hypothetical protein
MRKIVEHNTIGVKKTKPVLSNYRRKKKSGGAGAGSSVRSKRRVWFEFPGAVKPRK